MPEKFEVTLVANDQFGSVIDSVKDKVKSLESSAQKANAGITDGLTGKDAQSGMDLMDKKFSALAGSAKKNAQLIGDMIPPMKNFGELSGKYLGSLGKLGLVGGGAFVATKVVTGLANELGEMSKNAFDLDVAAKNLGMSAEKLSMVQGAFQLAGVDGASAIQSVTGISATFNDIIHGRNNAAMSQLTNMGLDRSMIPTRFDKEGNETVIVEELLPVLDKIYDSISSPQIRHEFAKAVGIDAHMEQLLRGNIDVQQRYNRAYEMGLVQLEASNKRLSEFNGALTETSAALSGAWNRTKGQAADFILSDGSVVDGVKGIGDFLTIGDSASGAQAFGFNRGDDAQKWRHIRNDPEFETFRTTQLGWWDRQKIDDFVGILPDGAWDKYIKFKKMFNPSYQDPFTPQAQISQTSNSVEAMDHINRAPVDEKQRWLNFLEKKYGLPSGLLDKVWATESARGKKLISAAGAEGPFQFMPSIGPKFGLDTTDDRMDFAKSSEAAARYLAQNADSFGGDIARTVASYNWGGAWRNPLSVAPLETQNYLAQIMPGLPAQHNPRNFSGINARNGSNLEALAAEFTQAIQQNPTQINIRITDDRNGKTYDLKTKSGGEVTTAMTFNNEGLVGGD